ncbi:MAG: DNA mismatch repair endonuclease MutL [Deltaproteobacteria bacterium]|nr:DNA mismatch repair endonuclease MutL [Deltaproteobacteria bacterium]
MPSKIVTPCVHPLPDALIDQIAAGEVVERPASVVKELVENALDAGARQLRVDIRAGGADFVGVTDDGCGMTPEDAQRALERHATSKLATVEDLSRIATYGFRGEALPAIASVSSLLLRTRPQGAAVGHEIRVEQGRLVHSGAAGGPVGTRIEVADLFGSVPARRKFLKKPSTEWGHVSDWLARAALALPGVHFEIQRDERRAQVWPATDDGLDRVAAVLGEEAAAALLRVEHSEGPLMLEGFTSRPDAHRPTLGGVYLFVNGRPIRDRTLQHALVDVYRDWLPRGRFPSAVLFVTLPLDAVDVNVHPAKWEVRFAEPRAIHSLVRHGVRAAVSTRRWVGEGAARDLPSTGTAAVGAYGDRAAPRSVPAQGRGDWVLAGERSAGPTAAPLPGLSVAETPEPAARLRFGDLQLLGQLLATYLVLEGKDRLLLVDQHAAHERVLYERLRAEWHGGSVESQGLLTPLMLSLDPARQRALLEAQEELAQLGFEVDAFGEATLAVRAVPALLSERDPAALVRDLADELVASGDAPEALRPESRSLEAADRLFAQLACHSARRKGDALEQREQRALLDALDAIPWAPTCPHGRPVAVPFDLAEIERRFGRR